MNRVSIIGLAVGTEEALAVAVNRVRGRVGAAHHACTTVLDTRTTQFATDPARVRTHFPHRTPASPHRFASNAPDFE